MKNIGILQPGRLGDIIICLPIARYYNKQGYNVIWPIFHNFIKDIKEVVDYVTFIPITNDVYKCVDESLNVFLGYKNINILDIAATFPGSQCTEEYNSLGSGLGLETFDQFKYRLAGVPFDQKWDLEIHRNIAAEEQLFNEIITVDNYNIVGLNSSSGKTSIRIESKYPNIEINENYNFFHWITVLERAKHIVLVDSAMANLVDQLQLSNKKTLLRRPYGNVPPTFRGNWKYQNI